MPRLKPPFPSQVGYLGRPTLINNVETLAHIPAILRERRRVVRASARGARPSLVGTGPVAAPGCYEAPNGVTPPSSSTSTRAVRTDEIGAIVPGGAASGILPARGARRSRSPATAP